MAAFGKNITTNADPPLPGKENKAIPQQVAEMNSGCVALTVVEARKAEEDVGVDRMADNAEPLQVSLPPIPVEAKKQAPPGARSAQLSEWDLLTLCCKQTVYPKEGSTKLPRHRRVGGTPA